MKVAFEAIDAPSVQLFCKYTQWLLLLCEKSGATHSITTTRSYGRLAGRQTK